MDYLKPKMDRSPIDIEYAKSQKECIFKPKICKRSMILAGTSRQRLQSPSALSSAKSSVRGGRLSRNHNFNPISTMSNYSVGKLSSSTSKTSKLDLKRNSQSTS